MSRSEGGRNGISDEVPREKRAGGDEESRGQRAASQPIRVGVAGEASRELFIGWAAKHLPQEDIRRVQAIDRRYRETAKKVGLFDLKPVTAKAMQATREKLNLSQAGARKPAVPTSSSGRF